MAEKINNFNVNRSVFLFDEIDQRSSESVIANLLAMGAESDDDIFLFINSYGGEVSSMNAILDVMNGLKSNVVTVVFGEADSAAAILSSAGTKGKRIIGARSKVMIHEVSKGIWGTLTEIEDELQKGKETSDKLFSQLSVNTGKSKEELQELVKGKDVWMNATEAIAFGMADKSISDNKEDLLEILFDTTINSAGEKHLNIKEISIETFKNFSENVERLVKEKETHFKESSNSSQTESNNKENIMSGESTEKNGGVNITPEQIASLVKRIDELTSQTTEANKAKSEAETALNKLKSTQDAAFVELNSKIKILEEEKASNDKKVRESAVSTFRESALKAIPKEVTDELIVLITETNASVILINKLTEAVNKVNPLVKDENVGDKEFTVAKQDTGKSEMNAMSPAKKS